MKAKLTIDNKEFEVEISEEELKRLGEVDKKLNETGYEKGYWDDEFWYVDECGEVDLGTENNGFCGHDKYNVANYYSDKTVAENNARADTLMRKLRRFAAEHRQNAIDYKNDEWYELYYDYTDLSIKVASFCYEKCFGGICFNSQKTAELAVEYYKDELLWYFTEYKDSL